MDVFDPESSCLVRYSRISGSGDDWTSQYFMSLPGARTTGQVCATAYYNSPQKVYAAWFREGGDGLFFSSNQSDEVVSIDYNANQWVDIAMDLSTSKPHILYETDEGRLYYTSVDGAGDKQDHYIRGEHKFTTAAIAAYGDESVRVLFSNDSSIMSDLFQCGVYQDIEYLGGIELRRAVQLKADGSTRMGYNYSWLAYVDGQAVLGDAEYRIID